MFFFENLKSEKKMTFNHWRYRLLHWFWAINPKTPEESSLPNFFYTHFCPLFHVTNLIFLFSPLIMAWKIVRVTISFLVRCVCLFCDKVDTLLFKAITRRMWGVAKKEIAPPPEPTSKEKALNHLHTMLLTFGQDYGYSAYKNIQGRSVNFTDCKDEEELQEHIRNFLEFYRTYCFNNERYAELSEDERLAYVTKFAQRANQRAKAENIRRQKEKEYETARKNRMIFWANFSAKFFKLGLNAVYVGLTLFVAYIVLVYGLPFLFWIGSSFIHLVSLLSDVNYLEVGIFLCKTLFSMMIAGFVAYLGIKLVIAAIRSERLQTQSQIIVMPFRAMGEGMNAVADYVNGIASGIKEFISVFYEENCPPITITGKEPEEEKEDE